MSTLKAKYKTQIKSNLVKRFGYANYMMVPSLVKIVISMGLAEASKDKNILQEHIKELSILSGQKPLLTKAKTSVAGFKLREGQTIGAKVTLRGVRMFDFMDRFFNIACPRIRDFRGFSEKCDGRGSYSLGLQDQQIFPEINLDAVKRSQGMNITFVTTAKTDTECAFLLKELGLPFKKQEEK